MTQPLLDAREVRGIEEVGGRTRSAALSCLPICGSTVFHTEEGREHEVVMAAVGAFADPSFPPPQDSVFDSLRHPWVQLPPGVVAYAKDPDAASGS